MTSLDELYLADTSSAWMKHASCRGVDPEVFFPERNESPTPAKQICVTCPVARQCLAYAVDNHIEHGIWGGTTVRYRKGCRRGLIPALPLRKLAG